MAPPEELLELLLKQASFLGRPFSPLTELLASKSEPHASFDHPPQLQPLELHKEPRNTQVLVSDLEFGQHGIATLPGSELLLTVASGIMQVNLTDRTAKFRLPVDACSRNALPWRGDSIYFIRKHGIGRRIGEEIATVAGGFVGNTSFMEGLTGSIWAFSNSETNDRSEGGSLITRVGDHLGDEEYFRAPYGAALGTNAGWVDENRVLVIGNGGIAVLDLNGDFDIISREATNPMGLLRLDGSSFLCAADEGVLIHLDVDKRSLQQWTRLAVQGSIYELARSGHHGYLYSHYSSERGTKGIVIRFDLPK